MDIMRIEISFKNIKIVSNSISAYKNMKENISCWNYELYQNSQNEVSSSSKMYLATLIIQQEILNGFGS